MQVATSHEPEFFNNKKRVGCDHYSPDVRRMFATVRELASLVEKKNPPVWAEGPYGYLQLNDCGDGTVLQALSKR
jgi:hypothetical protein